MAGRRAAQHLPAAQHLQPRNDAWMLRPAHLIFLWCVVERIKISAAAGADLALPEEVLVVRHLSAARSLLRHRVSRSRATHCAYTPRKSPQLVQNMPALA